MVRLLKVPEFSERLEISPKTTWAWIGSRKVDVHRVGRAVRIPETEVARILNDGFTPRLEHVQ